MKDLLKEIWIPLALLIIVVGIQILFSVPFNISAFVTGAIGGSIGVLLYN